MAHLRGLRESGGLHVLRVVSSKAEPTKLTTKLARLDHQRGLLERQLAVWSEKQKVTKRRLNLVEKQIVEIGRAIRQLVTPRHTGHARKRLRLVAADERAESSVVTPSRKDMNLEY